MSIPVTNTFAPAQPDCCVRSCQDVLNIVEQALTSSIAETINGVIIQLNTPSPDQRGNLWIVGEGTMTSCSFTGIKIWCDHSGTWIDFTFDPATITAGPECTVLGTDNGVVKDRTMAQVANCIPDLGIPCSKVNFNLRPSGCANQTWNITIQANSDSVDAGRIEFELTWTSATCGVGRAFVTESPIVLGNNYTLDVCMPSDAANITITNLKGVAVGGWSNSTVSCTPPTCLDIITENIPQTYQAGPFTIPTTAGSAGEVAITHGLPGRPIHVSCWFRCSDAGGDAGYSQGDQVPYHAVKEKDGNEMYGFKVDATTLKFFRSDQPLSDDCIINYSTGNEDDDWDATKWQLYVVATYQP